jgi:uncharacterized protein (DUF58 family)
VLSGTGLAVASVLTAVLAQRPYLLELGIPALLVVVAGLLLDGPASLDVRFGLDSDRLLEGDDAELIVLVRGHGASGRVVLELPEPAGVRYADDTPAVRVVPLTDDDWTVVRFRVESPPWGVHRWGGLGLRVPSPLGLVSYEGAVEVDAVLRVTPGTEVLAGLARASRTGVTAGSRLARTKGQGFEFADIRTFHPGDRRRDVNWRASARRGDLRVNDHHPERSTDVVLLVDAFPSAALGDAVSATVSLVTAYLGERDRVGLVRFGGRLDWLTPGMGQRQLYRIVDSLLEASALYGLSWMGVRRLPRQALPSNALVLAVTPLADSAAVAAITDVAAHGMRLAVVEVGTQAVVQPGESAERQLAYELWRLEVAETRDRLRDRGIPVVSWDTTRPLAPVIEEVAAFQRYARNRSG